MRPALIRGEKTASVNSKQFFSFPDLLVGSDSNDTCDNFVNGICGCGLNQQVNIYYGVLEGYAMRAKLNIYNFIYQIILVMTVS